MWQPKSHVSIPVPPATWISKEIPPEREEMDKHLSMNPQKSIGRDGDNQLEQNDGSRKNTQPSLGHFCNIYRGKSDRGWRNGFKCV